MNWNALQKKLWRRKSLSQAQSETNDGGRSTDTAGLRRSLTAIDLILYGVGSSVGAGIYVLVGLGAQTAGPAICLSFLACGLACILTSLCYAEFAARIAVTGSAFVYAYVAFGEFLAWLVGWNLTLGYGFTTSVVARAWADYLGNFLDQAMSTSTTTTPALWVVTTIRYLTAWPLLGHEVAYRCSPLSMVIVGAGTLILLRGVQDSSRFNNFMTVLNISVLLLVICAGAGSVEGDNLTPFLPSGVSGAVAGAGLVFFAFIGFDMVASLSEEVIHPERNMPIGIVGSLILSTCLYVSVALVVVGMAPIDLLGETVPVINALLVNACCTHQEQLETGAVQTCLTECSAYSVHPWLATVGRVVSVGAILGLKASCFTSLMGQPRILFSLAREGLIPSVFGEINAETQVPDKGILVTGVITAALACLAPMESLANLISLGTLMVFTLVNAGALVLRIRQNMNPTLAVPVESTSQQCQPTREHKNKDALSDPGSRQTVEALTITMNQQQHETQNLHHLHHSSGPMNGPQHFETSTLEQPKLPATHPPTVESTPSSSFQHNYKRQMKQAKRNVIRWIVLFTFGTLGASLFLSHAPANYTRSMNVLAWCCILLSCMAAYYIATLPPSWRTIVAVMPPQQSRANARGDSSSAVHTVFSCPFVPIVPLAGIACNTFMMGSLPLESWALCLAWMGAGAMIYFAYGMHHAVLNWKDEGESLPLMPVHGSSDMGYAATGSDPSTTL
mmetsp:Transcript_26324/g.72661  ORF Transcript_26324/g.72661 Transcript_26324/m.72661 type:complete len:734 (-) Transcript_26324:1403-3604(-)|eukprot:CAMPEP_0168756928 /NCGR_PEP_ID=MMETSP0724-20121128/20884_1 /TAXON_ID=265536 /ORGANISM="Amphiprora sp., Strain CCMP467" /LENGTH=733 /DNA_ID=CAMNT_0008805683 /DNA_START=259 /DNA_END=2460 /DNA_ORIENTATION=-